jgi:hypothetical protein
MWFWHSLWSQAYLCDPWKVTSAGNLPDEKIKWCLLNPGGSLRPQLGLFLRWALGCPAGFEFILGFSDAPY